MNIDPDSWTKAETIMLLEYFKQNQLYGELTIALPGSEIINPV